MSSKPKEHPILRFKAPMAITAGQPLKDLFDSKLIGLIGESFARVTDDFDRAKFKRAASKGLEPLTMIQRAAHIADAMANQLPDDFREAAKVVTAALGPKQSETEGNGLRSFFYMPHSALIAKYGVDHFKAGMALNYELTQRFTAEFCVRPFIMKHQKRAMALLLKWTKDKDTHVRRLCSEGSRPRLPWASFLPALQADPTLSLPILEALKDDAELYVRRSVANHLGDLCKDHPEWIFDLCSRWIEEVAGAEEKRRKERHWMIRHAVRLPAKKKVKAALDLRLRARV
ncbi:MAG: 3-methyladenine DNA glycosylase AlkC [Planctomycetota bacterium]|jgi:3-methyladenine DNA glycosylase AlkC